MLPLSIPSPPPSAKIFEFGTWLHSWIPFWPAAWTLPIHSYAICILVGILAAVLITNYRLSRRGAEPWIIIDIGLWAVVLGIIGARLYHVFTHVDDFFGPGKNTWNPFEQGAIWNVWDGGLAIFGGLIGGAIGVTIGCRLTGLRFWAVADALAPALLVAQAFGRLGNWFNQELFGLPTDLPWGLVIDRPNPAIPTGIPDDALFHPTFLYEIIWNLVGFAVILLIEHSFVLRKSTRFPTRYLPVWPVFARRDFWHWGKVLGLYLVWYGLGRSWLESIRLDPLDTFLGIRYNVWGALAAIVLGLVIIIAQTRRHPGVEPSVYVPGRVWISPAELDSEDTYTDTDDSGDDAAIDEVPATSGASRSS